MTENTAAAAATETLERFPPTTLSEGKPKNAIYHTANLL